MTATRESDTTTARRIWDLLAGPAPVVVSSHVRIDGDGLGAALALWHALRNRGVACCAFFDSPIPAAFAFLPGLPQALVGPEQLPRRFQLAAIDCGSLDRTGRLADYADRAAVVLNIDHHSTNAQFGDVNYVDSAASSSGEMIYRILAAGGAPITREIADNLYTAIITDTGRFSFGNSTAEAFEICGRLVRAGCRPDLLADRLYFSPPEPLVRLQTMVMATLRLAAGGRIATMEITREMFERTGTHAMDTQGFADLPIGIQGVCVGALLKEMQEGPGRVKVSLRGRPSVEGVDVCSVAESLGGGGHRYAAGCELEGDIEQARRTIVDKLRGSLKP